MAALGAALVSPPAEARMMSSMMPKCAAGDKVVWVNTRSKVFYEPGGSYYGKTKHGKYVCESQAMSMGMHMAKMGMMGGSNGMMGEHSGMMGDAILEGEAPAAGELDAIEPGFIEPEPIEPEPIEPDPIEPPFIMSP